MKRRFNASAKRATTKASESNKTLTITIPKESETMKTAIKATASGKLHLSNFKTSSICVKNNKPMNFVEVLPYESALKVDKSAFCKRCFGDDDPHKVIEEMIKLAGDDKSTKKLTTVDATESMQKKLAEKVEKKAQALELNDTHIEAIYKMIDHFNSKKAADYKNSGYKIARARHYREALDAIVEMIETNNVNALNELII